MADLALIAVAAAFALMGVLSLAAPARVLSQFGVPALTRDGRNEVRGVYGGFGVAVAALLLSVLAAPPLRPGACLAVAVALVGMALGRLVSAFVDRGIGKAPLAYLAFEIVFAGLALYAMGGRQAA